MRDEELLITQCEKLKAINPSLRCFVYRNLVKVGTAAVEGHFA